MRQKDFYSLIRLFLKLNMHHHRIVLLLAKEENVSNIHTHSNENHSAVIKNVDAAGSLFRLA